MKSFYIPKNISLKLIKNCTNYIIIISYKNYKEWFVTKNIIEYNSRIISSNKYIINLIKKIIKNITLGNTRKLILTGTGAKAIKTAEDNNNILSIKLSNSEKMFLIDKDINIKIINNIILFWSNNISVIDNLILKIIKNWPKKYIKWS